jgi:hypothetical protein
MYAGLSALVLMSDYTIIPIITHCQYITVSQESPPFPVTPATSPPIFLQQPTRGDVTSETIHLENLQQMSWIRQAYGEIFLWMTWSGSLRSGKVWISLSRAVWSEFTVVDYEDRQVKSDWVLIQVEPDRMGTNYIASQVGKRVTTAKWIPPDGNGVYLRGIRNLSTGIEVSKTGRPTGWTSDEGRRVTSLRIRQAWDSDVYNGIYDHER